MVELTKKLGKLAAALNEAEVRYPGTRLWPRYEAPDDESDMGRSQKSGGYPLRTLR